LESKLSVVSQRAEKPECSINFSQTDEMIGVNGERHDKEVQADCEDRKVLLERKEKELFDISEKLHHSKHETESLHNSIR
jgi:hypothetical protein